MDVQVRVFASLREALDEERVPVEVPDDATAGDLLDALREAHPAAAEHPELIVAVGREVVDEDAPIDADADVAVFPPVSGGGLREEPLDLDDLVEEVRTDETGAVATFVGVVRRSSRGRTVERLEYDVYGEMAEASLTDLEERATDRFDVEAARVEHRVGSFDVGDPVVWIAVAAAHRGPAFEACRWLIDTLKEETPIWKKEHTADGSYWVEDHA